MRAVSLLGVVVLAAFAGAVTTLFVGIGCFHCGATAAPLIFGSGLVAAVAVGVLGFSVRRRLLNSAVARQWAVALVSGAAAAAAAAMSSWAILFNNPGDEQRDQTFATAEQALPTAIEAGGRYRWPGTTVTTRAIDGDDVEVTRRWLGMLEADVRVSRGDEGWTVGGATLSVGWFVQVVIACLLPSAVIGVATAAWVYRRR